METVWTNLGKLGPALLRAQFTASRANWAHNLIKLGPQFDHRHSASGQFKASGADVDAACWIAHTPLLTQTVKSGR